MHETGSVARAGLVSWMGSGYLVRVPVTATTNLPVTATLFEVETHLE
jgi:hypothetical protein